MVAARAAKAVETAAKAVGTGAKAVPVPFAKVHPVSPVLKKFLGVGEISRNDLMKSVWSYIKDNKLQNPERKTEIVCDDKLKTIFGKERVGFLEVPKLLSPHVLSKKEST